VQEAEAVDDLGAKHISRLPSTTGVIARLAYFKAKAAAIALNPLLVKAGLTRHQMEDPRVRLQVRAQIKFLNLAASALDDDLLGFHLAQFPDLREIGLLYYVLASSETLIDVLRRGARYSSIVNEGISLECVDGKQIGTAFHYRDISRHSDRHQIEYWMTAVMRTCRQLTGLQLVPKRVRFAHPRRRGSADLDEFFGRDVEFGAAIDEITFTADARELPVVSADPHLNKLLITYCEEAISRRSTCHSSFRSSVENAIAPLLPHGKARAGEIARRLGMSQRTFARRLSLDGLSFSELLQNLRRDLAERYLADQQLSISQVAWLLGYEEVGAFSHAFKRWTDKTPRQARSLMASK
jgi:AraC-like DNA-binding protein